MFGEFSPGRFFPGATLDSSVDCGHRLTLGVDLGHRFAHGRLHAPIQQERHTQAREEDGDSRDDQRELVAVDGSLAALLHQPDATRNRGRGQPGIPTNVLSTRLKEFESCGLVERRLAEPPSRAVMYELTEYGRELEKAVLELGRWGARSLTFEPGMVVTREGLVMALRTAFNSTGAGGPNFDFALALDEPINARVANGRLEVPVADGSADLVLRATPDLRALMGGELDPDEAIEKGMVLKGDRDLVARFTQLFCISPAQV